MAKPRMHTDFVRKIKVTPTEAPFSLLPAQIPANGGYGYPLRRSTMTVTVKLYRAILEAVRMYARTENTLLSVPYMMIEQHTAAPGGVKQRRYYLETIDEDGDTLLFEALNDSIRISKIAANDAEERNPLVAFAQQTDHQINMVMLAALPRILQVDIEKADSKLYTTVMALGAELEDADNWTDANDIPDLTKEHLYYTDAAIYALDAIELDFGDSSSTIPKEINDQTFHRNTKLNGAEVCKNLTNGWTPRFIESNGTMANQAAVAMTIGAAKNLFSNYSALRQWTPMEQMLIPSFPDDMLVMPEVIRFAKRITDTHNDLDPVVNVMWRASTGYGKSCGSRQLACILNLPYTHSIPLEIIRRNDAARAKTVFGEYCPDWTDAQFAEAETLVSGIEYATMMTTGDSQSIDVRISGALDVIMKIYGVPQSIRRSKIEKSLSMDYRNIGGRILKEFMEYINQVNEQILDDLPIYHLGGKI